MLSRAHPEDGAKILKITYDCVNQDTLSGAHPEDCAMLSRAHPEGCTEIQEIT